MSYNITFSASFITFCFSSEDKCASVTIGGIEKYSRSLCNNGLLTVLALVVFFISIPKKTLLMTVIKD